MNKFNKVVVVIVLFKIILFSIAVVVNKFTNLFEWAKISNKVIGLAASQNIYLTGGILLVVFVVCIVLLVFEFRKKQ